MTDNKNEQTTMVLGGTGKTGRRIVQRLQARGIPVRIGKPSATRRSTGPMRPPGRQRWTAWDRCM
jgi:uncharacterized protein YbjT (DUF2867 family)